MKSRTTYEHVLVGISSIFICSCTSDAPRNTSDASRKGGTEIRNTASHISREKKSGAAQSRDDQLLVIGHLEFRDKIVTIFPSSSGPRYTITTKEGKTIASRLGEQELHAKFPELYQSMKTGVAGNDASF